MIESFYIGAYWGSRGESLAQVRDKAMQTLQKLSEIDEQFFKWCGGGNSREEALENRIFLNNETIERLCLEMVRKGELDKNGFAKMGFLFSIGSEHPDDESSIITFNVGKAFTSPHLSNSCVITIPVQGAARDRLLHIDRAKKIITILVEIWSPNYAVLTSHQLRDNLNVANKIGWITYHKSIKKIPNITSHIIYEKENNGHWFYIKENNFSDFLSSELLPIKVIF